jgi:hypothetical protein
LTPERPVLDAKGRPSAGRLWKIGYVAVNRWVNPSDRAGGSKNVTTKILLRQEIYTRPDRRPQAGVLRRFEQTRRRTSITKTRMHRFVRTVP